MADFTLTFLGTGTSHGIPIIGCDCAVCASDDPRDRRLRASVYIETPECAFLVDSGPDFRQQALREKITRLDAVVLTHEHTDHIMGFDDLRVFSHGGREMPVHGSAGTLARLQAAFAFAFDGKNRFRGYLLPVPHVVDGPFFLGATEIVPLCVPHGRVTTLGYLFLRHGRKIAAYFCDCKAVPPEAIERIAGVDTLIVDALRHAEHPTHMNVAEALATAAAVGARETWFTHLCHDLRHADIEPTLPASVRVAYDGLKLHL